jgi:iron complex transport system substrate-binding protein
MRVRYCCVQLSVLIVLTMLINMPSNNCAAMEYTDAVGRSVELSTPPQRIVSLVPSVTEILYAIAADHQLVGVTDFCNYPAAATAKVSIGSYANPGLETVASLQPDLIIMDVAGSSPISLHQFEQLALPVYIVATNSLDSTINTIAQLGKVTGHEEIASAVVADLRSQIEQVKQLRTATPVRALVCVMVEPLIVAGRETIADDLINIAGGVNVAAGQNRYPGWSIESVLALDPELIIVSPHPGTPSPVDCFAKWPQLQAVRNHQVVNIDADLLQRPGPRLIGGLWVLAREFKAVNDARVANK